MARLPHLAALVAVVLGAGVLAGCSAPAPRETYTPFSIAPSESAAPSGVVPTGTPVLLAFGKPAAGAAVVGGVVAGGAVLGAVVPGGAHPSYAHGYYERDNAFYLAWDPIARDRERFTAWIQRHILETENVEQYRESVREAERVA